MVSREILVSFRGCVYHATEISDLAYVGGFKKLVLLMKETKAYRLVIGCLVSHKYEQEIQLSDLDMLCTNLLESKEKQKAPLRLDPRQTFLINFSCSYVARYHL